MIIRPATTKDLKSIKALISRHPKQLIQTSLPKSRDFFVMEHEGDVIACCALEVYSKRLAEVRSLVVDEKFRKRGIATKLVRKCLQRAKKMGVHEVLSVTGAVSLFEKQGFKMFNNEKYALLKVMN